MESISSVLARSRSKSTAASNPIIISLCAFEQVFGSLPPQPQPAASHTNLQTCPAVTLEPSNPQPCSIENACPICSPYPYPCPSSLPCPNSHLLSLPTNQIGSQTQPPPLCSVCSQTQQEVFCNQMSLQLLAAIEQQKKHLQIEWQKLRQNEREIKNQKGKLEKEVLELGRFKVKNLVKKISRIVNRLAKVAFGKVQEKSQEVLVEKKIYSFYQRTFKETALSSIHTLSKEKFIENNRQLEFSFKDQHKSSKTISPLVSQNTNILSRVPRRRIVEPDEQSFTKPINEMLKDLSKKKIDRKGINYPLNYKK